MGIFKKITEEGESVREYKYAEQERRKREQQKREVQRRLSLLQVELDVLRRTTE